MEKRVAHYNLDLIRILINKENYRITGSAFRDAMALGFDEDDILEVVLKLSPKELYKSMTTHNDNTMITKCGRMSIMQLYKKNSCM